MLETLWKKHQTNSKNSEPGVEDEFRIDVRGVPRRWRLTWGITLRDGSRIQRPTLLTLRHNP